MFVFSDIEPLYYLLPLVGFIVGLFGTMLGGGGGFFFLPLLTLVYATPAHTAIITSLVATLPICFVGTLVHYKQGNVDFKEGSLFIYTGIFGALVGTAIASRINSEMIKAGFGLYLVAMAINMMLKNKKQTAAAEDKNRKVKGGALGVMAGMITGLFGTSGTAPVLAGLFTLNIPLKKVIGTSLLIVLLNALVAIGAHLSYSQIDLTLVYFLTSGSVLGALAGPFLLKKSSIDKKEKRTKYIYAAVIAAIGFIMIIK